MCICHETRTASKVHGFKNGKKVKALGEENAVHCIQIVCTKVKLWKTFKRLFCMNSASLPCLRVMDMLILLYVLELLQSHRLLSVIRLPSTSTQCRRDPFSIQEMHVFKSFLCRIKGQIASIPLQKMVVTEDLVWSSRMIPETGWKYEWNHCSLVVGCC